LPNLLRKRRKPKKGGKDFDFTGRKPNRFKLPSWIRRVRGISKKKEELSFQFHPRQKQQLWNEMSLRKFKSQCGSSS